MVETDDEKEADVSKPLRPKRPLGHVPLKIIIRRKRPENIKIATPPPDPPSKTPRKVEKSRVLPYLLLSKYADISELITAFENEKPKSLQETWHSVRQRQQEEEIENQTNGRNSISWHYAAGFCDFGADCEMPWLHPVVDVNTFGNHSNSKLQQSHDSHEHSTSDVCNSSSKEIHLAQNEIDPVLQEKKDESQTFEEVHFNDWRYGPAKFWYDQMNVPDKCEDFTYGFKLNPKLSTSESITNLFSDDAYLMVSQLHWEDDVIWNGADVKPEGLRKLKSRWFAVGGKEASWERERNLLFASGSNALPPYYQGQRGRTYFPLKEMYFRGHLGSQNVTSDREKEKDWKSIFPYENEDLSLLAWENEIIWDAENMSEIPRPKLPLLDPNDENIVLAVPDDVDCSEQDLPSHNGSCVKLAHPHIKNSKIVIAKTGIAKVTEENSTMNYSHGDPFNISNDSYYSLISSDTSLRLKPMGKIIQHSIPALELRPPFIPTHLNHTKLASFHRPSLKNYSHGLLSHTVHHPVYSLTHEINLKAKLREEEREASGGGEIFFMRDADDLSGRDGDLVLIEFSEEHPLLMNEVGMCSKIVNYYKRKANKDEGPPEFKYGEMAFAHTSPFLGSFSQGQCIQAVENNLYRCPIYEHHVKETDFLIIRTRHCFEIREVNALFVAGQQCPLYEVPAPHSRCATNFVRDFLQVHIYRMFKDCQDYPKWLKIDEIKKAFPSVNEINIRKCLKLCAEYKRVEAMDSSCWVLKPDFRLPTEEEMRAFVTPEQCCAQFSMMAAEQRLKDAGYGGNSLFVPPDDEDEEDEEGMQIKIDDEIKAAPWNLTRNYIQSLTGKCLLEVAGAADPTGCGEGFSYIKRPNRPRNQTVVTQNNEVEREKPSVNNAKILLRKMGVPEKEIKRLSCWELVDIARSISKKKMRVKGKLKRPKVRPMTTAEHVMKYKEDCQQVFDLQNRVLQSCEELSTDEDDSSEEDGSDVEEMGKILEKLLSSGKTYAEMHEENEEREREELVKMMMQDSAEKQSTVKDKPKRLEHSKEPRKDRVLKISRTFQDSHGKEYTRVEFVRKSSVIDIYMKIRATKDEAFIRQFVALESAEKQRALREKRLIENQLLRIKQREHELGLKQDPSYAASEAGCTSKALQEEFCKAVGTNKKDNLSASRSIETSVSGKAISSKTNLKRKCGACGNPGHNKGNKVCPLYCGPLNVAMTQEEEEEYGRQLNEDDQNLVNVDGTKLKLSVKLIKRAEEMKRKTLVLRVPKDVVRKRKRPTVETHCDYLENYQRRVNRRRVDPVVVLSNAFEMILNEMRDLPDSDPFHFPVNPKVMPHYYNVIPRPMDLQTIRDNLRQRKYHCRKSFLEDVLQIVRNSTVFNGSESPYTTNANKMLDLCARRMSEQEEELIKLEETINPSDDEKDQMSVSLDTSAEEMGKPQNDSKSIFDLTISETEDEVELDPEYVDARACPVVP